MTPGAQNPPAPAAGDKAAAVPAISTQALITAMLDSGQGISDLVFSLGPPPQVEKQGQLTPVPFQQPVAVRRCWRS